jgi:hypothetical protein
LILVVKTGESTVGAVPKTTAPVPVSPVTAAAKFAVEGVARKAPTFDPSPVTPVEMGKPVALVRTPLAGVPSAGVTRVGEVANTTAPVPVSSVIAAARLALEGVARKVTTFEPWPVIPVDKGRPVALVKVALAGVPRIGATKVGDVAKTRAPLPVSSVTIVLISREVSISLAAREPPVAVPSPSFTQDAPS